MNEVLHIATSCHRDKIVHCPNRSGTRPRGTTGRRHLTDEQESPDARGIQPDVYQDASGHISGRIKTNIRTYRDTHQDVDDSPRLQGGRVGLKLRHNGPNGTNLGLFYISRRAKMY